MTRRLLFAATVATSAAALITGSQGLAVAIPLLAGWLRDHALLMATERRLGGGDGLPGERFRALQRWSFLPPPLGGVKAACDRCGTGRAA